MARTSVGFHLSKACLAGLTIMPVSASHGQPAAAIMWPNSPVARIEALALIESLNARLLASPSATSVLEKWCADHRLAREPRIIARRIAGEPKPVSDETRTRLGISADDPIRYRRVQLICGDQILSEADNWYVPSRLTAEMNTLLDASDTPFGKVVKPLIPSRRSIAVTALWSPLPDGWEMTARSADSDAIIGPPIVLPNQIVEHRALLLDNAQRPIAEVVETYTSALFAIPRSQGGTGAKIPVK